MTECLFCKIVAGAIPSKKVFANDDVYAFADIHPQAPVHVLIVPKKHIDSVNQLRPEDSALMGELYLAAKAIAKEKAIDEDGYRCVVNCNANAGQTVFHIHLHLLGGRALSWPPG